jgi:hypothetical protein
VKCQRKVFCRRGKCVASRWLSGASLSLNKEIIRLKLYTRSRLALWRGQT